MAQLIYAAIASLDGLVEDESGAFEWAAPDDEVHAFVNDTERTIGTHLLGRRMYETMAVWETDPAIATHSPVMRDFAEIWQGADKIVYSTTLDAPSPARTPLERRLDPELVAKLKKESARDLGIGGPELAAHAFRARLVDECHLFLAPVVIGRGKRAFPTDVRVPLELVEERRFDSGFVFLRYRVVERRP